MKTQTFWIFIFCIGLLASCKGEHFITDKEYLAQVKSDFLKKKNILSAEGLYSVLDKPITIEEKEALMFLYAYMPIGDITDYSGDFYLKNVQSAFRARREMAWGKYIPENIFRHFVLPIRVNNENLDDSRWIFYDELKGRVQNLSLYEAILEVNHWCHEKVVYAPSDVRTSSPLASVRSAYGRCGEESTLLVAALRSVGIPARQVYTPRWAHTDDNHAWVEAWADGKWYFLGACEPEPVLNLGWFNAPSSRGMLMDTKVFGYYTGPEEVISRTPTYTEINVVENYAPVSRITIKVADPAGNPVPLAKVEFKVYNYAEFYTVATRLSDKEGYTSLTAGKGDMLVWASKGPQFGYSKVPFTKSDTVCIVLNKKEGENYSFSMDIVPPSQSANTVKVTSSQREENNRRLAYEDSVRNNYVATFMNIERAAGFARQNGLDSARTVSLLIASRGNHEAIRSFLSSVDKESLEDAFHLLEWASQKDLRDTPDSVWRDYLVYRVNSEEYALRPRIANEWLTPFKSFLKTNMESALATSIKHSVPEFITWCQEHIIINDSLNPLHIPISPAGVYRTLVADKLSRDIFFVAVLRYLGIPARINEVTGKVQYIDTKGQKEWIDVNFEADTQLNYPQGKVQAHYSPTKTLKNPQYYTHYTLSKFKDGTFHLLNFPEGENGTWECLLKEPLTLDTGYYMLVTGTRLANGSVLSNLSFFTIEEGKKTIIDLVMREDQSQVQVIGNFNPETTYLPMGMKNETSLLQTTGRGYFIIGILGVGQEPTNHALRDIAALKEEFERWGRPIVLLFPENQEKKFHPEELAGLPSSICYGIDTDGKICNEIIQNMKLQNKGELPIFIIADTFNRVVYLSSGYTIGLGEQLIKVIHRL